MELHIGNKVKVINAFRGRNPFYGIGAVGHIVGIQAGSRMLKVKFIEGEFRPHDIEPFDFWYVSADRVELVTNEPATQEQLP